ncbi:DUF1449 domain-containing protein [Baaleninema sp.]|uniref:DUF1449 domain-containing protein n=1 Tax=Baaleninema sp. TaxID=3101197 RepID=UPI003D05E9A1
MFDLANLPYWIFLVAGIVLFVVAISIGGEEELDDEGEFVIPVLGWLGIGRVPLMLLLAADLSLWGLLGWLVNVAFNLPKSPLDTLIFIATGIVSVLLGGAIARPLGRLFFASFSEDASSDRLVGCVGTVSSRQIPRFGQDKVGQVDAIDPAKNLVTINAVVPEDAQVVPKRGDAVIVIEHQPPIFIVIAQNSIDRDRWLGTS